MAKKEAGEKGGKTNLYLLAIVAIVAIVGIVVLILNSGSSGISLSSDDLSGQAIKKTCDPPCTGGKTCTASGCEFPSGLSSSDISTQTTASVDGEDACTQCRVGGICCSSPNSCHGGSCY